MAAALYEKLLSAALMAGDLNQCCGLVRRAMQEMPETSHWIRSSSPTLSRVVELGTVILRQEDTSRRHLLPAALPVLSHLSYQLELWESALLFCGGLKRPPSPTFLAHLMNKGNFRYVYDHCDALDWPLDVGRAVALLGSSGAWLEALTVARHAESTSPWADRYSCGVLIPFLLTGGSWAAAISVFGEAIAAGALLDHQLIAHTVRASAKSGDWASMLILVGALQKATVLQEMSYMPEASLVYRDVALATPHWRLALSVLHMAVDSGVRLDQQLVGSTIAKCDAAGAWKSAAAVYDIAVRSGCVTQLGAASYSALIRSFHALSQWERAVEAISWMSRVHEAAAVAGMTEMVSLSEKSGQWDVALKLGSELVRTHAVASSSTYLSLMQACDQGRQWAAACLLFHHIAQDLTVTPHPMTLCTALHTCGLSAAWAPSLALISFAYNLQPRLVVPPLALRLALSACVEASRWYESLSLLDTMQRNGLPMDNHSRKLGVWATALSGAWCHSLRLYSQLPAGQRTSAEQKVIRSSAMAAGPMANALVLKHLHSLR